MAGARCLEPASVVAVTDIAVELVDSAPDGFAALTVRPSPLEPESPCPACTGAGSSPPQGRGALPLHLGGRAAPLLDSVPRP